MTHSYYTHTCTHTHTHTHTHMQTHTCRHADSVPHTLLTFIPIYITQALEVLYGRERLYVLSEKIVQDSSKRLKSSHLDVVR